MQGQRCALSRIQHSHLQQVFVLGDGRNSTADGSGCGGCVSAFGNGVINLLLEPRQLGRRHEQVARNAPPKVVISRDGEAYLMPGVKLDEVLLAENKLKVVMIVSGQHSHLLG
jgi:hypothetical protein